MAEAVLFSLATTILKSLVAESVKPGASFASQKIQFVCCLKSELQSLKDTVEAIQAVLLDAEKQHWHNRQVTLWLRRLKEVLYDVQDFIDNVTTEDMRRKLTSGNKLWEEVRVFFSESNQLLHRLKVANEIQKLRKRLDGIAENRKNFSLEEQREEPMVIGRGKKPEVSKPDDQIIGREKEKEEIKQLLFNSSPSQSVSVVAIVGKGGLGKTGLAQLVYSDGEVEKHFELKTWVCVSYDFDVKLIIKGILESAKEDCLKKHEEKKKRLEKSEELKELEKSEELKELEESLRDFENRALDKLQTLLRKTVGGKKYLLVLDDVWIDDRNRWLELGDWLKDGLEGSKLLVTTRDREVAKVIDKASVIYYLQGLPRDESWHLFREAAFGDRQTPVDQRLEEMGRVIVGKCAGVPLAIRTVGTLLYGKNEDEWLRYEVLDLPEIPGVDTADKGIMQYLQFSYDHLSSGLKQCFAYCSLFPKDYVYRKDVIICLWMAQGFIDSDNVEGKLEERADKYFSNLRDRSFLDVETVGNKGEVLTFKMHDLMHDLARKVAGAECKIVNFNKGGIDGEIRHALIIPHDFSQEKLESFLEKSKLRTFIHLVGDGHREESVVLDYHKVFSAFMHCRVLSFLGKTYIPLSSSSFGKLKHLRFLDISENPSIENLPNSITDLLNLETLILSSCGNLSTLPRDLGKLINLRFLDVSGNKSIESLPDSIVDLVNLRTLKLSGCNKLTTLPRDLGKLDNLRFLDVSENGSIKSLPNSTTDLVNLETLKVSECNNLTTLPRDLGKLVNLKFLDVSENGSIKSLPNSITDLVNLQTLKLSRCPSLKALPRDLKKLINLRHLLIDGCSLSHMPCGLNHLSSLQTLSKFVVQKMDQRVPEGAGIIDELGGLNKLAGSIRLENLEFLQPTPEKGHLREKEHLRSLDLNWWGPFEERDEKSESDELIMWENLRPHQNLTNLEIHYFMGRNPPSWLSSITYLVTLTLYGCNRWKFIQEIRDPQQSNTALPLRDFPSLRELCLHELDELEFVQEIRDPQQSNTARPFFPSLERLHLVNCGKLRGWWGSRQPAGEEQDHVRYDSRSSFPKLLYVKIRRCDNLKSLPLFPSVLELRFRKSSMKVLEQQVMALPNYSLEAASVSTSTALSKLKKIYFAQIWDLDHSMLETLLPLLRNLESVGFTNCSALRSLSSGMQYLSSLQHLEILSCKELDLSSHDDEHGTQWRSLANLHTLQIRELPKLEELPVGIQHVTTLQSLYICSCENLTSLPEWIGNFSLLQDLHISHCPGIKCLPDGLLNLTSLKRFRIGQCPALWRQIQDSADWEKIKGITESY